MKVCTANFKAFTSGLAFTAISKSLSNLPKKENDKEQHDSGVTSMSMTMAMTSTAMTVVMTVVMVMAIRKRKR